MTHQPVSLLLSALPLALDTFAIAAVVGACRPRGWTWGRISAIFVLFEGGMPLVGLAAGASLALPIEGVADYLAGGLLLALAGYLRWADDHDRDDDDRDDDDRDDERPDGEVAKAGRLTTVRGLALLGLGLSISLDELVIGLGLGLSSHHATPAEAAGMVMVMLIQTVLASQLGLSLGTRISPRLRERIEELTIPGLAVLGAYLITGQLIHVELITVVLAAVPLVLAALALRHAWRRARGGPEVLELTVADLPAARPGSGLRHNREACL